MNVVISIKDNKLLKNCEFLTFNQVGFSLSVPLIKAPLCLFPDCKLPVCQKHNLLKIPSVTAYKLSFSISSRCYDNKHTKLFILNTPIERFTAVVK